MTETKRGWDVGIRSSEQYVMAACEKCGKERWVKVKLREQGKGRFCQRCGVKLSPSKQQRQVEMEGKGVLQVERRRGQLYVQVLCPSCQTPRWVRWYVQKRHPEAICHTCVVRTRPRIAKKVQPVGKKHDLRYTMVVVPRDHPFHCMANKCHHVGEHRLVMAEHLGRPLTKREHVHHKNGIRSDNRLENLLLVSRANHDLYTHLCADCSLRKEIRLLQWQLKELREALQERMKL